MTSEGNDPSAPATGARTPRRPKVALPGREADARPAKTDLRLCPFLITDGGAWRAAFPVKEHVCGAVAPAVPLALDKQRRLCLTEAHRTCPAFLAGLELRDRLNGAAAGGVPGVKSDPSHAPHRPVPSTTPVLLERARSTVTIALSLPGTNRASGQGVLVALLVVAFIAIALARFGSSGGPGQPSLSPTASSSALIGASMSASPLSTPSPAATPSPTPEPSVSAAPTPSPLVTPSPTPKPSATVKPTKPPATPRPSSSTGTRTYTVKFGDTLSSIASHFGTSVPAIQALNGMGSSTIIHPGQVLQIP